MSDFDTWDRQGKEANKASKVYRNKATKENLFAWFQAEVACSDSSRREFALCERSELFERWGVPGVENFTVGLYEERTDEKYQGRLRVVA